MASSSDADNDAGGAEEVAANVAGNARLTGMLGAVIFVLLFVEGLTILSVDRLMWLHAFVGMLLVAFAGAKIGTTSYRFARYYRGQGEYVRKGPPPIVLRILGPVVTATTVAVLATGIGTLLVRRSHWLGLAHKASFIVWFGAMSLHVLGHALETPALALADGHRNRRTEAPGAATRIAVLVAVTVAGVGLAVLSLRWVQHWHHVHPL